jgi:ABC-2 type transport system ATP-binding protein
LPAASVISVENVSKSFRDVGDWWDIVGLGARRVQALRSVSLEVAAGEIVGLLGPNGAGKTTLLKILATLVLPDAGAVRVAGQDATRQPEEVCRRVGVMLEHERSFYRRLTGRANLEFFAALQGLSGAEARRRIDEQSTLVGLSDSIGRRVMTYSLGIQHRLGLARALLRDPEVLLLDEPTRSLDPLAAQEFHRLLRDELARRRGKAILLASHNLVEVEHVCDRLAVLRRGELVAVGTREELARRWGAAGLDDLYRKAVGGGDGV